MNLLKRLREKHRAARQRDFQRQAEEAICLADFNDSLYIAFNGIPCDPVNQEWTPKEILERLSTLRNNYVNVKMHYYV